MFLETGAGHCIVRGPTGTVLRAWSAELAGRGDVDVAFVAIGRGASTLEPDVMAALFEALDATVGLESVQPDDTQTLRSSITRALREDRERPLVIVLDGVDGAVGWSVGDHPFYWRDDLDLFRSTGSGVRVVLSTSDANDDGSRTFGAPVTCLTVDADEPALANVERAALLAAAAGPITADELRAWIGAVNVDDEVVGENEHGLFLRDPRVARRLEREEPDAVARARTLLNEVCVDAVRASKEPSRYALRHAFVHLERNAASTGRSWLVHRRDVRACIADVRTVRLQCHGGERTLAPLQVRCAVLEATLPELSHAGVVDFDRAIADSAVIARFVTDAAEFVPTVRERLLALARPIAARAVDVDPVPLARIAPDEAFERLASAAHSAEMNAGRVALLGRLSEERTREVVRVLFASPDAVSIDAVYQRAAAIDSATAVVLWTESACLPVEHRRRIAAAVAAKTSVPAAVSEAFSLVLSGTADGVYDEQRSVYAYLRALVPHLGPKDLERLVTATEEMKRADGPHFPDGSPAEWGRELARLVAARHGRSGRPPAADVVVRRIEKGDISLLERRATDLVGSLGPDRLVALARSFADERGHRARLAVARAVAAPVRDALIAEAFARFRGDTPTHIDRGFDFVGVADALPVDDAGYLFSALLGRITEGSDTRASLFECDLPGSMRDVLPLVARFGDAMFVAAIEAIVAVVTEFP